MGDLSVMETLHRMYFSLTALMFNGVLCIMIPIMDKDNSNRNRSFSTLVFTVFFGNLLTCITSFIRHADSIVIDPRYVYLAYLISCLANIYVTGFFSVYMESYFVDKHEPHPIVKTLNRAILIASPIAMAILFICKAAGIGLDPTTAAAEPWVRYLFGYAFELYFLLYTLIFFSRHTFLLNKRAFITALWGVVLTVGGIILQLLFPMILVNYVGASLALLLFYFGVETTDYRKLNKTLEELEVARESADRANQFKSEFLANMSHEIRTPINAVLGMNEMIIRESKDPQITEYAKDVENSGKNLLSIINDILDFSKIEAGRMEISESSYKLSQVIHDLTNLVKNRADEKGLELDLFIDETMPNDLYGDEVRLKQVVLNLLTNSVKYTEHGSVSLSVEGDAHDGILDLKIAVSDTGIGIRDEDKDKLFDQFTRVDVQHNRTIEGTGLGLAITHKLITMMGGSIEVESSYGVGSTFTITIPQKIMSDEPIGNITDRYARGSGAADMYRRKFSAPDAEVLVVDDTSMNIMVFKYLLKETEVKIDCANSAREAIIMSSQKKYDVIFMDQRMPHMDGTQALNEIRKQKDGKNTDTPMVCMTADAVEGARERYLNEGFDDYLTKPVEGDLLEDMLVKYLPRRKVISES